MTKGAPLGHLRLSKKVCSPLGPLCEGAPPAGGGGENCTAVRNISGYGKVLSLRPFGAPLPLWRKRHLPRIGGVCLAEGGFSTRWGAPLGHLFLYALPLLLGNWLQLAYNAVLPKASPSGLRPQARVEAQPPEAALSAETEAGSGPVR